MTTEETIVVHATPVPPEEPVGEETPTKTTLDVVADLLTSDDWHFDRDPSRSILRAGAEGKNGTYRVVFDVKEERSIVIIYVFTSSKIPEQSRKTVSEFLTRANYGIILGNFEMDFNDGELRYKASIDFRGGDLAPQMIRTMLGASLQTMDRYFGGIMAVTFGHVPPTEAIRETEEGDKQVADAQ